MINFPSEIQHLDISLEELRKVQNQAIEAVS